MADLVVGGRGGSKESDARAEKVRAFINLAMDRWKRSNEAEADLRKRMLDDKKFYAGEQWDPDILSDRRTAGKPTVTVNKMKHPVRLVTNQARTTKPRIQINPVDSGSDPDTAEVFQGIIRNIETQSDAAVAYQTALEDAAISGLGWFSILPEYSDAIGAEDESAFQQEIRIRRERNRAAIYGDPAAEEADRSDMTYLFRVRDVPRPEYLRRWPKSEMASLSAMTGDGNTVPEWASKDAIRVADYYQVKIETVAIALVLVPALPAGPDGTGAMPERRTVLERADVSDEMQARGVKIIAEREIDRRSVEFAVINAVEILDGNDDKTDSRKIVGRWIPFVPVLGEELDIDGKLDLVGIVRDAKDGNRTYNYEVSTLLEQLGMAPKAPYIMAEGQDEGHEEMWKYANTRNYSALKYKPVTIGNQLAPPPQRTQTSPDISATVVAIQQSDNDIKAQTMFFDASLGERGPTESGKAIMARQRQGEMGSSHYMDNLGRAIRHAGRILVDIIPQIYSAARVMRIIGTDGQSKEVTIHNAQAPEGFESLEAQKAAGIYDIGVGRFDVTVSIGASSETQRQEAVELMMSAVQANPALFQVIGDLIFENMDFGAAKQIAKRLKKMLPPQLQDDAGKGDPQQLQAQLQQMQQAGQQLQQAYQQATQALESQQADAQAKVEIEQQKIASAEKLAKLKADTDVQLAEIRSQSDLVKAQAELAGQRGLIELKAQLDAIADHLDFQRKAASEHVERVHAGVIDARDRAERAEERAAETTVDA